MAHTTRFPVSLIRAALVILSIALILVAVEAALRVMDKPQRTVSGWTGKGPPSNVVAIERNQLEFRGQRIDYVDGDFVIVLVGDSFVVSKSCAFEWMPERRLQFHLNATGRKVKVFSVAASGYGQDQQLLGLRNYFKTFRANLVVLWETPINDIWNNLFPTSFPAASTPKPTFWLEDGQLRGPSEEMGQPIRETSNLRLLQLWRRVFHWSRDAAWIKNYPPAYVPMSEYAGEVKDDWQARWEKAPEVIGELDSEKAHLAMALTPRSERMTYGLSLTRKLIQEMQRLTVFSGGRFVAFTHHPYPTEAEDGVHVFRGLYYKTSRTQYVENVNYINQGIEFFVIPVTIEEWRVGPEDHHLNEHATDQVMADLAKRLNLVMPAPSPPLVGRGRHHVPEGRFPGPMR